MITWKNRTQNDTPDSKHPTKHTAGSETSVQMNTKNKLSKVIKVYKFVYSSVQIYLKPQVYGK